MWDLGISCLSSGRSGGFFSLILDTPQLYEICSLWCACVCIYVMIYWEPIISRIGGALLLVE